MAYVKKISYDQFAKDMIDFELKPYGVDSNYIFSLPKKPTNKEDIDPNVEYIDMWYCRYTFRCFDEFNKFRQYFYEHWKDYAPKRKWKKEIIYEAFERFNLFYGLATDYDFNEHMIKKNADDMFIKVYVNNRN